MIIATTVTASELIVGDQLPRVRNKIQRVIDVQHMSDGHVRVKVQGSDDVTTIQFWHSTDKFSVRRQHPLFF